MLANLFHKCQHHLLDRRLSMPGRGAFVAHPSRVALALKAGHHEHFLLRAEPSLDRVVAPALHPPLGHHLPVGGVQMEVDLRLSVPPGAPAPGRAQGTTAEDGRRRHVDQIRTQGLVYVPLDGVARGLRGKESCICHNGGGL